MIFCIKYVNKNMVSFSCYENKVIIKLKYIIEKFLVFMLNK